MGYSSIGAQLQGQLNFTAALFRSVTFLCCFLQLFLVLLPVGGTETGHKKMTREISLSMENTENGNAWSKQSKDYPLIHQQYLK